jgi:glycerol-3-phosphate cytidylyltransferase-like family protein
MSSKGGKETGSTTSNGGKDMVSMLEKVLAEVRSGLVSSVVAEAALFPLDVVKLRQQVYGGSVMDVLRGVLREQGPAGLYKGLIGRLIQTITSNVGFFIWQTIALQTASERLTTGKKLGTGLSLVLNMLAQQFNRLLTTPVDVVANVNQADPNAKGFLHTFVHLARTGGVATLWRGLPVALILSLNPALMFTLVGRLSAFMKSIRHLADDATLQASDMFWISGASKMVATLVTYPLIRAKAKQQSVGTGQALGLWATLIHMFKQSGFKGLYEGVWILSYKTVLFNSLMMALKQQFSILERKWLAETKTIRPATTHAQDFVEVHDFRKNTMVCFGSEKPWEAKAQNKSVGYIDGSWSYLHPAQEHVIKEAASLCDYLIIGVHSDSCHKEAIGDWPPECYSARLERILPLRYASAVLQEAPWQVEESLMDQLGITKVITGSLTKMRDCNPRLRHSDVSSASSDPYAIPKKRDCFFVVQSLNETTEHDMLVRATRVFFSNVDASIDWRILVRDDDNARWGHNPGYDCPTPGSAKKRRASSVPPTENDALDILETRRSTSDVAQRKRTIST